MGEQLHEGGDQEERSEGDGVVTSGRPGRALIGGMTEPDAALALAARRTDRADDPALLETAAAAREAVAKRAPGVDQNELISDVPGALDEHIAALRNTPQSAAYFAEGWDVALVDLRKVCSL